MKYYLTLPLNLQVVLLPQVLDFIEFQGPSFIDGWFLCLLIVLDFL